MMDYDIPSRPASTTRSRSRPGIESPTDLAAASRGLGRGPRDGPARRRPAADGRALRHRRARHPAHRHPCLPALTPAPRATLPHTWRPFGVRMAGDVARRRAAGRRRVAWFGFDEETRGAVHAVPARHRDRASALLGAALGFALVRSRVVAEPERLVVVNGYRTPRATSGPRSSPCTCRRARPGSPSTSPTAPPSRPWASRAPTAPRARQSARELRAIVEARSGYGSRARVGTADPMSALTVAAGAGGRVLAAAAGALAALRPAAKPLHPEGEVARRPARAARPRSPQRRPVARRAGGGPGRGPALARDRPARSRPRHPRAGVPGARRGRSGGRAPRHDGHRSRHPARADPQQATPTPGRSRRCCRTPATADRSCSAPRASGRTSTGSRGRTPRGRGTSSGTLYLGGASDARIAFDPVLHQVPGLRQYSWVARLREPAYRIARRSRGD